MFKSQFSDYAAHNIYKFNRIHSSSQFHYNKLDFISCSLRFSLDSCFFVSSFANHHVHLFLFSFGVTQRAQSIFIESVIDIPKYYLNAINPFQDHLIHTYLFIYDSFFFYKFCLFFIAYHTKLEII